MKTVTFQRDLVELVILDLDGVVLPDPPPGVECCVAECIAAVERFRSLGLKVGLATINELETLEKKAKKHGFDCNELFDIVVAPCEKLYPQKAGNGSDGEIEKWVHDDILGPFIDMGIAPERIIFVGDQPADFLTAMHYGFKFVRISTKTDMDGHISDGFWDGLGVCCRPLSIDCLPQLLEHLSV